MDKYLFEKRNFNVIIQCPEKKRRCQARLSFNKDEKALCLEMVNIIEDSASFEQLKGVAEYLILFAEEKAHHEVLCAVLAKMGCYEILCNVLPKLGSDGEWIEDTLLLCLESSYIFSQNNSAEVKAAFKVIRDTINKCETERLYNELTKGVAS